MGANLQKLVLVLILILLFASPSYAETLISKDTSGILKAQPGEVEIIEERTRSFKKFRLSDAPDGRKRYRIGGQIGPIHYRKDPFDENELYKEIDLTVHLTPDEPWDAAMETNGYQVRFWQNLSGCSYVAEYRRAGTWLRVAPLALIWQNNLGEEEIIAIPQTAGLPEIDNEGHHVTWHNVFGEGIDFRYNIKPDHFFKAVIIKNRDALPEPSIGREGLKLDVVLGMAWSDNTFINGFAQNHIIDKLPTGYELIEYDQVLVNPHTLENADEQNRSTFWIQKPKAWDSAEQRKWLNMSWSLNRADNKVFGFFAVEEKELEDVVYPVYIDTNMAGQQVTADEDDGFDYQGSSWFGNIAGNIYLGNNAGGGNTCHGWFRFLTVPLPQGCTIDSASLTLQASVNESGDTCDFDIKAEDEDSATLITSDAEYDAVSWTAAIDWDSVGAWTADSDYTTPDIATPVQTVVNRGGWALNNDMGFTIADDSSSIGAKRQCYAHEGAGTAAKFACSYTETAADHWWISGVDTDWNTIGNWSATEGGGSNGTIPGSDDNVYFSDTSSNANCTLSADAACNNLYTDNADHDGTDDYTGTLSIGANDIAISGSFDLYRSTPVINMGSGTWTVAGSFIGRYETLNRETSHLRLTGSGNLDAGYGKTKSLYDLTVSGDYTAIDKWKTFNSFTVSGTLTIDNRVEPQAACTLNFTGGTIDGAGQIAVRGASFPSDGTVSCGVWFYASITPPARTYGGYVKFGHYSGSMTATLADGTYVIGGDLDLNCQDSSTVTVTGSANNPKVTIGGDVYRTNTSGTTTSLVTGNDDWTVSGDVDLTGCTLTAGSSEFILNGSSNQTIASASQSFYDLTITNASASPGVTFADSLDVDNLFKATTANTTLTFTAGITATLADISLDGQASDTRITLRSTTTSTYGWDVETALQTGVSNVTVSYCDASTGNEVDASDGTNDNAGNNTKWDFGNNRHWVASSAGTWNTTANWATCSGGTGGASVPGSSDTAIFDASGTQNCTVDTTVAVVDLTNAGGYTGILDTANYAITISDDFQWDSGTLTCGSSAISIADDFDYSGGVITAGTGTFTLVSGDNIDWIPSASKLYDVVFNCTGGQVVITGTAYISHDLTLTDGQIYQSPDLEVENDISIASGFSGGGDISLVGTNDQIVTQTGGTAPKLIINKGTSGTVTLVGLNKCGGIKVTDLAEGSLTLVADLEIITGSMDASGGTVDPATYDLTFTGDNNGINPSSVQWNDITIDLTHNQVFSISGSTADINGTLNLTDGRWYDDASLGMTVAGNITVHADWDEDGLSGANKITLDGAGNQTITLDGKWIADTEVVVDKATGDCDITGAATIHDLTIDNGTLDFAGGFTYTFDVTDTLTVKSGAAVEFTGSAGSLVTLRSDNPGVGNDWNLDNQSTSTITADWVDVQNSNASNTVTATNSADSGNNTNWTFGAGALRYWVASSAGTWNTTDNWAASSGGSSGASVPGSTDNVVFDSAGTQNCTIDATVDVLGIDIQSGYSGTISQGANAVAIGSSGFSQADGIFTGGTETITLDWEADFTLSGGTFTCSSGTTYFGDNFTHTAGGVFLHNNGTVEFSDYDGTINVDTTETFYNFIMNKHSQGAGRTLTISSGDLVVDGTLTWTNGSIATGTIDANGVISIADTADGHGTNGILLVDGGSSQSFTIPNGASAPAITLNSAATTIQFEAGADCWIRALILQAGTFIASSGTLTFADNFTHTAGGTFSHNSGTVISDYYNTTFNVDPSETFYNLTLNKVSDNRYLTISSGDLIVNGTLTINEGGIKTGTADVKGNVVIGVAADRESGTIKLSGTGNQIITGASGGEFPDTLTINKSSGDCDITGTCNPISDINVTAGTLTFAGGFTYTFDVGDTLTVASGATVEFTGSAGSLVTLVSDNPGDGNDWNLDNQSTSTITADWVDVQNSNASNTVTAINSTDSDFNTNWDFIPPDSSVTAFTDSSGTDKTSYTYGTDDVYVQVSDDDENTDAGSAQTVSVTVTSANGGDSEDLTLTETGNDTGVFRNTSGLPLGLGTATNDDGTLTIAGSDTLTASYTDDDDATDTSSDTATGISQTTLSGTVEDANTNEVLSEVTVTLLDSDDTTVATTTTDDNGNYSFTETLSSGTYTLKFTLEPLYKEKTQDITVTAGTGLAIGVTYLDPYGMVYASIAMEPVEAAVVTLYKADSAIYTGSPQPNPQTSDTKGRFYLEVGAGKYYLGARHKDYKDFKGDVFTLTGSSVNENIVMEPLDLKQGQYLSIAKTVNKKTATISDILTYTINVKNIDDTLTATNVTITDSLPHDFKYVNGTSRLDNTFIIDPQNRRTPSWSVGTLTSKESKTLTYRVIIGPDVKLGKNKNSAIINGTVNGTSTSAGPSVAPVDIKEGLFTKRGMVIGKVFNDTDQDGIQDRGEKGIPYLSLILEDGIMVTTDEFGRYSIPDVGVGMHVLKLDQRMLPGGPLTKEGMKGPEAKAQKPKTEEESLIQRRSLGDWIKERLHKKEAAEEEEEDTNDEKQKPHYRSDIPQVSNFVQVPESGTAKCNFPIRLLTPLEEELQKKKHAKETQFMIVGIADGTLGHLNSSGKVENIAEGDNIGMSLEVDDKFYQSGKVVLYAKGKIKGEYLLTTRYDSTRNYYDHLYSWVNPEKYYPIYGDKSTLTNDADSQGKFFIRIDKDSSYAMLGNYKTDEFTKTELTSYSRTLHGITGSIKSKDFVDRDEHKLKSQMNIDLETSFFYAKTLQEQRQDIFTGRGISGPYYLTRIPILEETEEIRLEVRDKSRYDIVLKTEAKSRDTDYEIDYDTGRLMFREPVPTYDENNDPVYVVIDYEYITPADNKKHYIAGARQEITFFDDKIKLGGQVINENRSEYSRTLLGVDSVWEILPNTTLAGEWAQSIKTDEKGVGDALRVEGRSALFDNKLKLQAYATQIGKKFSNPVNVRENAIQKYGATGDLQITKNLSLITDHWMTRSITSRIHDRQTKTDLIYKNDNLFLSTGYGFDETVDEEGEINDIFRHRMNLRGGLKLTKNVIASTEYSWQRELYEKKFKKEIDVFSPRLDIKVSENASIYARHDYTREKVRGADKRLTNNISSVGFITQKDGKRSYVEYGFVGKKIDRTTFGTEQDIAVNDKITIKTHANKVISKDKNEENIGYNSRIEIFKNLYLGGGFERTMTTGDTDYEQTAVSVTADYLKDEDNALGSKFEYRSDKTKREYNFGLDSKLNMNDATYLLAKAEYHKERDYRSKEDLRETKRIIGGIGFRPVDNDRLNLLAKYEYKEDLDIVSLSKSDYTSHLASIEGIYDIAPQWELFAKYALKSAGEAANDIETHSLTDLKTAKLTYRLTSYLDVAGIYRILQNYNTQTIKQGAAIETGVTLFKHLRVAMGYNFLRYDDKDYPDEDYQGAGPYIQMSYKFDDAEKLLESREEENIKKWAWRLVHEELARPDSEIMKGLYNYFKLAKLARDEGNLEEAKELYKKIQETGEMMYDQAEECVRSRIELEKKLKSYNKLARIYYKEGKLIEAKELWQKIITEAK